jgi:Zn-dependent peptidase ImmA (M78 family)/transcriptional regulator with XRE-family HTH domain
MKGSLARIIPERLREAREARGFTTQALAERIGVSRQAIAQFEIGQSAPSADTMAKIYIALHQPPAFFTTPREKTRERAGTIFWRSLKRMKKHERDRIARRLDWLQDIVSYLEQFMELPPVHLPAPDEQRSDADAIEETADLVRKQWYLGRGPIPDVVALLEANGIVVVREPVHCDDMDAVSCWQLGRPVVLLASDKGSAARSRWDAAHELGHIVLHSGMDVDSKNLARLENEANRFAGAFLLPADSFTREVTSSSIDTFKALKRRWKVSIAAMIFRSKDLGIFNSNQIQYLWRQRAARGWTRVEPFDQDMQLERPRFLAYIVNQMLDNGVQSKQDFQDKILLCSDDIEQLCGLEAGRLDPTVVRFPSRMRASG